MQHHRLFLGLVLAASAMARSSTASEARPIVAVSAEQAERIVNGERIRVGTSRGAVLLLLGDPDAWVSEDCWIFWNFRACPTEANPRGFDALVISFAGDAVSGIKLADTRVIRRFLAQQKMFARR